MSVHLETCPALTGYTCNCWTRSPASAPPHVPTPEELDDLMAQISACGYASEAVEVVEDWTRKWWGVESAMTTRFRQEAAR